MTVGRSTYLGRMIEYNTWANQALLEFLGRMTPATLGTTAPGVYGTIGETLEHLLWSELRYHQHLSPGMSTGLPARAAQPTLGALQQLADESAQKWATLGDSLPEPETMMHLHDGKRSAGTIVTQYLMHGCEHRVHVGTILGAQGIDPPDLDAWAHGIFVGGDDWPGEWGPEPPIRRLSFDRR